MSQTAHFERFLDAFQEIQFGFRLFNSPITPEPTCVQVFFQRIKSKPVLHKDVLPIMLLSPQPFKSRKNRFYTHLGLLMQFAYFSTERTGSSRTESPHLPNYSCMNHNYLCNHNRLQIKLFLLCQPVHPAQKLQTSINILLSGLICVHS